MPNQMVEEGTSVCTTYPCFDLQFGNVSEQVQAPNLESGISKVGTYGKVCEYSKDIGRAGGIKWRLASPSLDELGLEVQAEEAVEHFLVNLKSYE